MKSATKNFGSLTSIASPGKYVPTSRALIGNCCRRNNEGLICLPRPVRSGSAAPLMNGDTKAAGICGACEFREFLSVTGIISNCKTTHACCASNAQLIEMAARLENFLVANTNDALLTPMPDPHRSAVRPDRHAHLDDPEEDELRVKRLLPKNPSR